MTTTRDELLKWLSTALLTALELDPLPVPYSSLWVAMERDLPKLSLIKFNLIELGYALPNGQGIMLTDKGRAKAKEIETLVRQNKATSSNKGGTKLCGA